MIQLKNGVVMSGLQLPMRKALTTAQMVWETHKHPVTVTSALDGAHGAGSLHYYGYALDFRVNDFPPTMTPKAVATRLRVLLGPKYKVILEKDHIHVEFSAVLEDKEVD